MSIQVGASIWDLLLFWVCGFVGGIAITTHYFLTILRKQKRKAEAEYAKDCECFGSTPKL